MTCYATVNDARRELGTATTDTTGDAYLFQMLRTVSSRLDKMLYARFEPIVDTVYLPLVGQDIQTTQRLMRLPSSVLELSAVTVYGTAVAVGSAVRGWPVGQTPFNFMQLVSDSGDWYSTYYNDTNDAIVSVQAIWGFHDRYSEAWHAEDSVQNVGGINGSVTSITVADADGTNWLGETPRFQVGQLIKCGVEFMRVVGISTTTNVLTVQRGINGTSGAAHAQLAGISIWYPVDEVRQVVARQAAMMYKRRGAFENPTAFGQGGGYPNDLLRDLLAIAQEYQYAGQ